MFVLDLAARTDPGLACRSNPDIARVNARLGLAFVVDGEGNARDANRFESAFASSGGTASEPRETAARLCAALERAIHSERPEPRKASAVAAAFTERGAAISKFGNTRCSCLCDGSLEVIASREPAQGGQRYGRPTEAGRKWEAVWTRAPVQHVDPEGDTGAVTYVVECEPGDIFLLCSDGVWGSVDAGVLSAILGAAEDARDACDRLVGAAPAGGI